MLATVATTRALVAKTAFPVVKRSVKATRVFAENEEAPTTSETLVEAAEPMAAAEPTPIKSTVTESTMAAPSFGEAMAFAGPVPEVVNGRLAMVAVVAALAAEFSSDESVLRQFSDAPAAVLGLVAITTIASFIPVLRGNKAESLGPFNATAEMANGRAAMLGLAFLLLIEGGIHKALF